MELTDTQAELAADRKSMDVQREPVFGHASETGGERLAVVAREWSTECALNPRAVALARTRTRTYLTVLGWTGDIDDAVLVVSELVTNAVRHGCESGRVGWLRLAVLEDGALLVDVSDPVAGFVRAVDDDEGGRGLQLVRRLGDLSWFLRAGSDRGKTVRVRLRP
ncbi:ATP-binding protein [Streptomyces sp. NBC_00237]|uniref:ATP-binding protein n=1 Tax=Streptomyces sp. NBC_00237 TaxID=2975687 RepID=UPI00224E3F51|nr:ATP-binding protein [Streptomyces sp. NBC_00237]MCX5200203.1 ATP-binding protein [Streptomyces sp. NBC_00237]